MDLVPGNAVDQKTVDLSTSVLGTRMKFPIIVAPSATQVPVHPDGRSGGIARPWLRRIRRWC